MLKDSIQRNLNYSLFILNKKLLPLDFLILSVFTIKEYESKPSVQLRPRLSVYQVLSSSFKKCFLYKASVRKDFTHIAWLSKRLPWHRHLNFMNSSFEIINSTIQNNIAFLYIFNTRSGMVLLVYSSFIRFINTNVMYMFLMKTVGIMFKLDNFHMISAAIMNSKTNLVKYFLIFKKSCWSADIEKLFKW